LNEIIPRLWLGDWQSARASSDCYVVTVAVDSPFVGDEQFGLVDGPGNSLLVFDKAVCAVVEAHSSGKMVLVHCVAGQSRSAAVVVRALTIICGCDWCAAYDLTISKKPNVRIHPAFAEFLTK